MTAAMSPPTTLIATSRSWLSPSRSSGTVRWRAASSGSAAPATIPATTISCSMNWNANRNCATTSESSSTFRKNTNERV